MVNVERSQSLIGQVKMFPIFKSEAKKYCTLFQKERTKAFQGMSYLSTIANEISSEALSCNDELEMTAKLKMLKRFAQIFEEFNHDVELAISQFDKRMIEVGKITAIAADKNHWMIGEASRIPKADLSIYKIGDRGKCAISYITSIENDLCFIVDVNRKHISRGPDFRDHLISHFDGLPDTGTVFAVLIDKQYFRAIRTHSESTLISYQVTLIDIGETICVPLYRSEKYRLSEYAAQLPPMAILCLVEKADGMATNCLQRLLGTKRFDFEITNICSNMLQVELFTEIDNTVEHIQNLVGSVSVSNTSQRSTPLLPRRNICAYSSTETNPFRADPIDVEALNRLISNRNVISSPSYTLENSNIEYNQSGCQTKKPQRVVPFDTSRILPKMNNFDDMAKSACQKGDNTSTCQLGAHPKNARSPESNGNNLIEKECSTIVAPPIPGQVMTVLATAVVDCEELYVQLLASSSEFNEFQCKLNQCVTLRNVTKLPCVGEKILARYDADGLIYRAQVTQLFDRKSVLVWYVDYGNTEKVNADGIYEWDSFCDTIPSQAKKCGLANIKTKEGTDREVKEFLAKHVLNKTMNAVAMYTAADRVMVRLSDKEGSDIGQQLCISGLAVEAPENI